MKKNNAQTYSLFSYIFFASAVFKAVFWVVAGFTLDGWRDWARVVMFGIDIVLAIFYRYWSHKEALKMKEGGAN